MIWTNFTAKHGTACRSVASTGSPKRVTCRPVALSVRVNDDLDHLHRQSGQGLQIGCFDWITKAGNTRKRVGLQAFCFAGAC
jgi:hypothetical protein